MRLERLDLIRFGRFEGSRLDMPESSPDLHIVAGRNEAGKTTTMAAIEALLFGFPGQTPYAYRHRYDLLRVGGLLRDGGETLEFRRRKGNRDTLLDAQDAPLPGGDRSLGRLLGGADREFFRRMFSLSHDRLAEGGREIAAAEGEVGETLFAVGSAVRGLRARRKDLDGQATDLWTKRRAKTRRFYQASDRLAELDGALRRTIRKPDEWRRLKKDLDFAQTRKEQLDAEYRTAAAESRRCACIRRVLPTVRRRAALDREIAALGEVVPLPEDAAARLAEATRAAERAVTEIAVHADELRNRRAQRDAIAPDPAAYERREAIRELENLRVKVAQMRLDLPKRAVELEAALGAVRRAAADLGWEFPDDRSLLERVPSGHAIAPLHELLQRRGALDEARKAAEAAATDAGRRSADQRSRGSRTRPRGDLARLAAVVAATPDASDLEVRIRDARREAAEAEERVRALRAGLSPALPEGLEGEAELRALPMPASEEIIRHRDRLRDLEREREDTRRRRSERQRRQRADQEKRDRIERDAPGITRAALDEARAHRDTAWTELRAFFVGESGPGKPADLAARFESLAAEADAVADRRFERAETAGRLTELDASIREREAEVRDLAATETAQDEEMEGRSAAWRSLWEGCRFDPRTPAQMLAWRASLDDLVAAHEEQSCSVRALEALLAEEAEAREPLVRTLAEFGMSAEDLAADSLRVLARSADDLLRDEREAARRADESRAALARAEEEVVRQRDRLRGARADLREWEDAWRRALDDAGLDPASRPSGAAASLLVDMREAANRAAEIRTKRIETMQRDISAFEAAVARLVSEIAPDLDGVPADEAALRMRDRMAAALDRRSEREQLDGAISDLEAKIRERKAARAQSEAMLAPLYQAAAAGDRAALTAAIQGSDQLRKLTSERRTILDRLERDGDDLRPEELEAECAGTDPDEARSREESAEARRAEASEERNRVSERLGELRKDLEAFEDDDQAAGLAADRQEALAAVRRSAERYARVRTAEILLRWALERFRKEKQGPMLRRAGRLFRTLTGGSFASLEVGFDSRDRLRLDAVREDGEVVQVGGLSSGSEDQLYLALRVAAVEDYAGRAPALPFIADDLFLNFDEDRAAAGFRILGELARSTQVLFFTHHEHLVEIAGGVLGPELPVMRLDTP